MQNKLSAYTRTTTIHRVENINTGLSKVGLLVQCVGLRKKLLNTFTTLHRCVEQNKKTKLDVANLSQHEAPWENSKHTFVINTKLQSRYAVFKFQLILYLSICNLDFYWWACLCLINFHLTTIFLWQLKPNCNLKN